MKRSLISVMALMTLLLSSCYGRHGTTDVEEYMTYSTYNVQKVPHDEVAREGTIVFVRPENYSRFGTTSLRDYIEVTHERAIRNEAGLLEVSVGLRNIGGRHYYDDNSPDFPLSIKTVFYDQPYNVNGQTAVPVYETNWQTIKMLRGVTTEYKVICPVKSGSYYQIVISEILKS